MSETFKVVVKYIFNLKEKQLCYFIIYTKLNMILLNKADW